VNQASISRAADARDADQHVERDIDIDIFQIARGAADLQSIEL